MSDEHQAPEHSDDMRGWITHTNLSSTDPEATRDWCQMVLGWRFHQPIASPGGDYLVFTYSDTGGGGIMRTPVDESPGSTPTVHVPDVRAAFDEAIAAGAEPLQPPTRVIEGVSVATVRAPGGVVIGLSGPTD